MRLKIRDVIGVLLALAVAVPYVGYLINGSMPFIEDPRGMAATGLVLGAAAFLVLRRGDRTDRVGKVEAALAFVAGVLGVVALALAETVIAEWLLAAFMVALLAVVVAELLDHLGVVTHHGPTTVARG